METHPLAQLTIAEAMTAQFQLMDCVFNHFDGAEIVQDGDLGVSRGLAAEPPIFMSVYTNKVEQTLAQFFGATDVVLLRGSGTYAIRLCLMAGLSPRNSLLLHQAPTHPTTNASIDRLDLRRLYVDYNDLEETLQIVEQNRPAGAFLQHSRNKPDDSYSTGDVVRTVRSASPETLIVVDDCYTALRVPRIGAELGADLSAFSVFKLLGPGVGCVVAGTPRGAGVIAEIRRMLGSEKVHGPEAMHVLRALTLAPVAMAVEAQVVDEVVSRLRSGEVPGVQDAWVTNGATRSALVRLNRPLARTVGRLATSLGAEAFAIGADSFADISAYVGGAVWFEGLVEDPWLAANGESLVVVAPFRTGPNTVIRVLREALDRAEGAAMDSRPLDRQGRGDERSS